MTDDVRGTVLVVEDEAPISDVLRMYLERDGFAVRVAPDGPAGLREARESAPVAIILDVGLPGMDGTEVCRALRAEGNWTPVLFCTARDDEVDRVLGLELGADDYITKPFSPREVVSRVRSVLRRIEHSTPSTSAADELRCGDVVLDRSARRVRAAGVDISMTATEFDLLAHLMESPGRVFTREQLLDSVWGYSAAGGTRTVDVHIAQVRAKLKDHPIIRTVRGVGYSAEAT